MQVMLLGKQFFSLLISNGRSFKADRTVYNIYWPESHTIMVIICNQYFHKNKSQITCIGALYAPLKNWCWVMSV